MKNAGLVPALACALGALLIQGCAHTDANRKLDEKLAAEPQVTEQSELQALANTRIEQTPGLSVLQKADLRDLGNRISARMTSINRQSVQLRAVLIKELLSPDYDRAEVSSIKKRLADLEDERVTTIFDGVKRANAILGRASPDMRDFWETFLLAPY